MTLDEIEQFAIINNACKSSLSKFSKLKNAEDKSIAWQYVLGNCSWLIEKGISKQQLKVIYENANGIGIVICPNSGKIYKILDSYIISYL